MTRLHFVDINPAVVDEPRRVLAPFAGVDVSSGDILDVAFDTLVSPANSYGFMDGGIDLHYVDVRGTLPVGSTILVAVRHERIRQLLVAPTMEHPEAVEPLNAFRAMAAILRRARTDSIDDVFCPGLCTLTGMLEPAEAADEMARAYARSASVGGERS